VSPSSDAFSHTHLDSNTVRNSTPQAIAQKRMLPTNGAVGPSLGTPVPTPRKPKNPFELYCSDHRSRLMELNSKGISQGTYDVDVELGRGWRDLNDEQKSDYQARFDKVKKGVSDKAPAAALPRPTALDAESRPASTTATADDADEDVDMAEDGDETPSVVPAASGFTAVNSG
jgi:non-histone protein 10